MNSAIVIPITVAVLALVAGLTYYLRGEIKDIKSKISRHLEILLEDEITIESEYFSNINDHYTLPTQDRIEQYRGALIADARIVTGTYVKRKDELRRTRARFIHDLKQLDLIDCAQIYNILVGAIFIIVGCVLNELYSINWYVLIFWFIPLVILFYTFRGVLGPRSRIGDGY